MKVWVMQGRYEGEVFNSVHFTQKGCVLACISDILEFHDIDDKQAALSVMNDSYEYTHTFGEATEPFEWDYEKMKDMTSKQLWAIFHQWCEISWDRMAERGYDIGAQSMEMQG